MTLSLSAQNLTLSQILDIKKKDLGNAEEFLTAKGWEFLSAEEPTNTSFGSATFTYKKSNMSSLAESFLTLYFSNFTDRTRLSIQINKKSKYTEYMNSIKGYGCKLLSSNIEDGNIIKVYRGATTTFRIISSTSTNYFDEETATWSLHIISNDDFDLNFNEN